MKCLFQVILYGILFVMYACNPVENKDAQEPDSDGNPNIIYILADDLGYGDLSCYGQKNFSTPNLDRFAAEGMLFTQHYSGSTVCAPSRSALMTGQHTGHTTIRGNKELKPEGQWPIPDSCYTLAEMLKTRGYVTGAFGKWGLGGPGSTGDPMFQGFDRFFGYNCQRLAHNYYPRHLWDNRSKVALEENMGANEGIYSPQLIHEKAIEFIQQNKDTSFFLFYPNVIPHAELLVPEEYLAKYRNKFLPEKQYQGVDDGDHYRLGPYGSQSESHAAFAAMVTLLDEQVGSILDQLDELRIADNTLVIFTSDNGPHLEGGADPDYFDSNGPLRGYKRDLYEGGIRVPMLAKWPGQIAKGSKNDHVSAFWDVMPTIAELVKTSVPENLDGISFLPTMLNLPDQLKHDHLYWEFHERGGRRALRKENWKLVQYQLKEGMTKNLELYDLSNDLGENNNLADEYPEVVDSLFAIMKHSRVPSPVFKFPGEK